MAYDIGSLYWKGYFRNEEDARKNDIFDLINASIALASIENPNEFRSRRMQFIESLFEADSKAPAKPEKRSNRIARTHCKNQEKIVIYGCKDHACKDHEMSAEESFEEFADHLEKKHNEPDKKTAEESSDEFADHLEKKLDEHNEPDKKTAEESFDEFADQLERDLEEHAQPIGVYNVNEPDKKTEEESFDEFANQLERDLGEHAQPIGFDNVNVPDKKPNKKRQAEVSKNRRSGTEFEVDKKRKVEENKEKRDVHSYEYKFEASKTRFEERNQRIEKAKRKVQVLDVKEIVPPSRLCRDGKPKRGFGTSLRKIQKARF